MIFDLLVILIVAGAMYLGYKQGTHIEIYRLGRVFLGMTLAGTLGASMGWKLTSMGFLSANTAAIVNLVGFLVVFVIYWAVSIVVAKLVYKMALEDKKINNYLGLVANGVISLIVIIFVSFISTQLSLTKDGYKSYLRDSSFSYIYMDRICRKVITADVVGEITGSGAGKMVIEKIAK